MKEVMSDESKKENGNELPTESKQVSSLVRNMLFLPGSLAFYLMGFVVALPIIGMVMYGGYKYLIADPPGYCAKQGRVLSDEEYFQIILGDLMKSDQMKLDPSETTVQAYLANHPKCCQVYRGDNDLRWCHFDGVEVFILYEMSESRKKVWVIRITATSVGLMVAAKLMNAPG